MSDTFSCLVLGGARSGKSAFAERLVTGFGPERRYIATGEARDAEMAARIAKHRDMRGEGWETIETPIEIKPLLSDPDARPVLVDCLTLWLSNLVEAEHDVTAETDDLVFAIRKAPMPIVFVSNELGLGLVPETPLGRAFRDAQGRLNQRIAAAVDTVVFVAAGLPLILKGRLP